MGLTLLPLTCLFLSSVFADISRKGGSPEQDARNEAKAGLQKKLKKEPADPDTIVKLGELFIEEENYVGLSHLYENWLQSLEIDPDSTKEKLQLAEKLKADLELIKESLEMTSVFNGRSLNKFKSTQRVFRVKKGEIIARQTKDKPGQAYLLWRRPFRKDFGFSVKMLAEPTGTDSAIQRWDPRQAKPGLGIVFGYKKPSAFYEFLLSPPGASGDWGKWTVYRRSAKPVEAKSAMSLDGIMHVFENHSLRDDEPGWLELRLEMRGEFASVFINDELVCSPIELIGYKGGKVGIFLYMCEARFKDLNFYTPNVPDLADFPEKAPEESKDQDTEDEDTENQDIEEE